MSQKNMTTDNSTENSEIFPAQKLLIKQKPLHIE